MLEQRHTIMIMWQEKLTICLIYCIDVFRNLIVSQGTSTAVAMDNTRQALQLCGKLLYAQMSEIVNKNLNNGLPPNLSGCDYTCDFGFKGMDIAMSAYMSELDLLTSKKILFLERISIGNSGTLTSCQPSSWARGWRQIDEIKQNRFFYGMVYSWFFAIFYQKMSKFGFWLEDWVLAIKSKHFRDFLEIS